MEESHIRGRKLALFQPGVVAEAAEAAAAQKVQQPPPGTYLRDQHFDARTRAQKSGSIVMKAQHYCVIFA